jgi:uncharacterized protein (TIGR02118 family)
MSARLIAIHRTPADPAAYDKYYFDIHVPLAKDLPGLRKYEVSRGSISDGDSGPSDVHLVAILHFDDVAAIDAAAASDAGKAAMADLPNFVEDGNLEIVVMELEEL